MKNGRGNRWEIDDRRRRRIESMMKDDQPQRAHRWHASECRTEVRREGNEHLTESAAKKAAEVAWMGAVRFRDGERYMAIENARDVKYSCVRSSVGDTALGAAASSVGANYHRCQMAAHPCQAPETREGLKSVLPAAKKK